MEAKFSKVRQRVSSVDLWFVFSLEVTVTVCLICWQQKREEYHRQKREKEEEEIEKRKQVQREKVSLL